MNFQYEESAMMGTLFQLYYPLQNHPERTEGFIIIKMDEMLL